MTSKLLAALALIALPCAGTARAQVVNVGDKSDMIMLTVDKSHLKAELKTWPEDPTKAATLRTFKIAIGKGEGDKEREGDNRTPEGVYFAQTHMKDLPQKYGPMAIPLDFPNPIDQIAGKTGHGIWLHGVERAARVEEAKVTEGCVAFYNEDIERLSGWIKSHNGVVVIAQDTTKINNAQDISTVRQKTIDWMTAWAARKIEDYMAFYAPDFHFEKFDLKRYHDYKKRVFASYKNMLVKYEGLRVITHPKYAVAFFNQDFQGDDRFTSIGRKVLYWEKTDKGEWKIKREMFENRRFEAVSYSDAEVALLSETGSSITSTDKDKKTGPNL